MGSTVILPPRGIAWPAMTSMLSSNLDQVFRQQRARQIPGELRLVILEEAARDGLGIAEIDLGARRPGRAERNAAELQFRRGRARALLDQIEREFLGRLVLLFLEHLEPVHDGADRADEVVAHARAQQGGEIERFDGRFRHRLVSAGHAGCHNRRIDGRAEVAR